MRSLIIIDSPFSLLAYAAYASANRLGAVDIIFNLGRNYKKETFISLMEFIKIEGVNRILYNESDYNWNLNRSYRSIDQAKIFFHKVGLTKTKLRSYNLCFLNSDISALSFYVSTVRSYHTLEHTSVDIVKNMKMHFFKNTIILFLKTFRFRQFPQGIISFEPGCSGSNPIDFLQAKILNTFQSFPRSNNYILFLWGTHYSYQKPFDENTLNVNKAALIKFFRINNIRRNDLIIKFHHRIGEVTEVDRALVRDFLSDISDSIVFVDEYLPLSSRYLPAEILANVGLPVTGVLCVDSAAAWTFARQKNLKVFSAHRLFSSELGRPEYMKKMYSKMEKFRIPQPDFLS